MSIAIGRPRTSSAGEQDIVVAGGLESISLVQEPAPQTPIAAISEAGVIAAEGRRPLHSDD